MSKVLIRNTVKITVISCLKKFTREHNFSLCDSKSIENDSYSCYLTNPNQTFPMAHNTIEYFSSNIAIMKDINPFKHATGYTTGRILITYSLAGLEKATEKNNIDSVEYHLKSLLCSFSSFFIRSCTLTALGAGDVVNPANNQIDPLIF